MVHHLVEQQSIRISRRTLSSLAMAAPIAALPPNHRKRLQGLLPVSMDRCVVVNNSQHSQGVDDHLDSGSDTLSPTWHCEIAQHPVSHWKLVILSSHSHEPQLTVIQPTDVHENAGLLAARITFRLHSLQRRGLFERGFNKHRIVPMVNQQIRRAMKNMPNTGHQRDCSKRER